MAVHANAAVLPGFGGPYVVQVRHDGQFHYLPRHELFHLFQYQYLEELDFGVDFLDGDSEINWWMEASAEWAAHRVGEAIEDEGASPQEAGEYARFLADFLGRPSEQLDRWDGFKAPRSYGSFILAGYLEETFGAEVLEEIWAGIPRTAENPFLRWVMSSSNETPHGRPCWPASPQLTIGSRTLSCRIPTLMKPACGGTDFP